MSGHSVIWYVLHIAYIVATHLACLLIKMHAITWSLCCHILTAVVLVVVAEAVADVAFLLMLPLMLLLLSLCVEGRSSNVNNLHKVLRHLTVEGVEKKLFLGLPYVAEGYAVSQPCVEKTNSHLEGKSIRIALRGCRCLLSLGFATSIYW